MTYQRVLPFDTDNPEFVRGFEAGRTWELLHTGQPFTQTIHTTNTEMVMRMAEATNTHLEADILDDRWMTVTLTDPCPPASA